MPVGPIEILVLLFFLAFWVGPSYLVANYARANDQSFWMFLFLGLCTSFVVSWVVAAVVVQHYRTGRDLIPPVGGSGGPQFRHAGAPGGPSVGDDRLSRLERLSALHRDGAITEAEFEAEKAALLARR